MSFISNIEDFHKKFKLSCNDQPGSLSAPFMQMRLNFLLEELNELATATGFKLDGQKYYLDLDDENFPNIDLEKSLDALVDLQYVLLGTAYLMGFFKKIKTVIEIQERPHELPKPFEIDTTVFEEAWRRVQKANMQKIRAKTPGQSKRNSSFDVIKPEGWKAPDLKDLV